MHFSSICFKNNVASFEEGSISIHVQISGRVLCNLANNVIGDLQSILLTTCFDNDETLTLIICLCNSKTKKNSKTGLVSKSCPINVLLIPLLIRLQTELGYLNLPVHFRPQAYTCDRTIIHKDQLYTAPLLFMIILEFTKCVSFWRILFIPRKCLTKRH